MAKKPPTPAAEPVFRASGEYFFSIISAWLLPGAGHWLLGHRVRGIVMGAAILALFWVGQSLAVTDEAPGLPSKPIAVSRKINPVFFGCQVGNGLSTLVSDIVWGKERYSAADQSRIDRTLPPNLNLAILFTSVSGLLNYLLILHVMDPRSWKQAARDARARSGEEGTRMNGAGEHAARA
jgi:hypothetical protein